MCVSFLFIWLLLFQFFIDDILHDIDVFKSWPGYGMLVIRMIEALWFLTEMRTSIDKWIVLIVFFWIFRLFSEQFEGKTECMTGKQRIGLAKLLSYGLDEIFAYLIQRSATINHANL